MSIDQAGKQTVALAIDDLRCRISPLQRLGAAGCQHLARIKNQAIEGTQLIGAQRIAADMFDQYGGRACLAWRKANGGEQQRHDGGSSWQHFTLLRWS